MQTKRWEQVNDHYHHIMVWSPLKKFSASSINCSFHCCFCVLTHLAMTVPFVYLWISLFLVWSHRETLSIARRVNLFKSPIIRHNRSSLVKGSGFKLLSLSIGVFRMRRLCSFLYTALLSCIIWLFFCKVTNIIKKLLKKILYFKNVFLSITKI